jgi:hypothetical protein
LAAAEKFSATLNGQDITRSFRPGNTAGTLLARVAGPKSARTFSK